MTFDDLQKDLLEELEYVFKDIRTKNVSDELRKIKGYEQDLPIISNEDDEEDANEDQFFPYFIVRIIDGEIDNDSVELNANTRTLILFGIYDGDKQRSGYKTVLHLIQRFRERFEKNPVLKQKYRMVPKYQWSLQDEDTHPYYFGGIDVSWKMKKYKKEDDLT